jgi:hypothetical protein
MKPCRRRMGHPPTGFKMQSSENRSNPLDVALHYYGWVNRE